ncbi:MAG TPA: hypothetical protein VHX38_36895 [Pseudonocardiaceae bacterium]|jgi:hypothetical protein|nr:hypothetical protein [Pseudonocardiaceae bacterium]
MTDMQQRGGTPGEPSLSVDLLADLHAGALPDVVAGQLWPRVRADPRAASVLAALEATKVDLAGLGKAPVPAMPADFAARLDAALAEENRARAGQGGPTLAPVLDLAARRRSRRIGWTAGLVATAAALIGAAIVVLPGLGATSGPSIAAAPPKPSAPALSGGQLGSVALADALHKNNYGPLADPTRLAGCLTANGQDPNQKPAGANQITLDGKPGTLLVLTTGRLAQFRLLVVGPSCSASDPSTLANQVIGGVPSIPVPPPTH